MWINPADSVSANCANPFAAPDRVHNLLFFNGISEVPRRIIGTS